MIIGIPKETWGEERRVALTPAGAYALTKAGHSVVVHADAGAGCGFTADAFRDAGATVVFSPEEAFARADLVAKVMPLTREECSWFPERKLLFSGVHLGAIDPEVLEMLKDRDATAVGLEFIEDADRNLPVLTAMSEIAGMLLPQIAGRYLESTRGGSGILLGGVAGIPASDVVIIGSGTVGATAARMFVNAGANVTVLDTDLRKLRALEILLAKMVNTALSTPYTLEHNVVSADVVVGAVMVHGRRAPQVVSELMVRKMRRGSVILDLSIDQGGCVETSRPTTLSDPVFVRHGVTHFCVPNIPASVARTASHALNNGVLSFIEALADTGLGAIQANDALRRGVYLCAGRCTHEGIAALLNWECSNVSSVLTDLGVPTVQEF